METNAELFSQFLKYLTLRTPMFLVALTGIVLALIKWRKHSKTSMFLVSGFGIYIVSALFFTALNNWLLSILSKRGFDSDSIEWAYFAVRILQNCSWALMLALILAAVFSQRKFADHAA